MGAIVGVALLVGCSEAPRYRQAGLNVLLISVDTLRADRVGAYGYEKAHTPAMDRLAREGVRFAHASAQVPMTLPSHASILTGREPVSHGVRLNGSFRLADSEQTLAEILAGKGYATGAVIAAVVLNGRYGLGQGFGSYDDLVVRATRGASELERHAGRITERALAWLERQHDHPFFLWVHYFDPHQPYVAPAPYGQRYANTPYDGEVAFVDDALGKLLAGLETLGLDEHTLILLTSDHGEGLGEHHEATHSYFVYESTLRVPLVAWCPGVLPAGRVVDPPVRTIDIVPTILDLLGLPPKPDADGTSLRPWIAGQGSPEPLEVYGESLAARLSFGYSPLRSLRVGHWKYVLAPSPELYDLSHDPGEENDLAQEEPERAAALRQRLIEHVQHAAGRAAPMPSAPLHVDPATRAQLAQLGYVSRSVLEQEVETLDQNLEPRGVDPKDVAQLFTYVTQGEGAHKAGHPQRAEKQFRAALAIDPGNEYALTYLGILYGERGEVDRALRVFDDLKGPPEMGLTLEILGKLYVRKGRWDRAIETFRELLRKEPHNVWGHYQLGIAYRAQGKNREALRSFENAVRLEPSLAEAHAALGEALLRDGQPKRAAEAYRRALALVPGRPDYYDALGSSLQSTGAYAEALTAHRKALELNPANLDAREHVALCLLHLGRLEEAHREVEGLIAARPESPVGWVVLGASAAQEGDLDWAAELLRKALAAKPDFPEAWYHLARVLSRRGALPEGREALAKAVEFGGESYQSSARADPLLARLGER